MVIKKCEIVFEENDGILNVSATNSGFSGVELVGLLETKKQDIVDQLIGHSRFKRIVKNPDGTTVEIEREKENEDE